MGSSRQSRQGGRFLGPLLRTPYESTELGAGVCMASVLSVVCNSGSRLSVPLAEDPEQPAHLDVESIAV